MRHILIYGGTIINEDRRFRGYIEIKGERIVRIAEGDPQPSFAGDTVDATGKLVMPGIIDDQVHFREPGLTYKADIHTESIAAVAGGVTSYMEMPNTKPPTVSLDLLEQKFERASETSVANYSFYLGATNDNLEEVKKVDTKHVCGIKLFMGSSTGNMLVDDEKSLAGLFAESPLLIATHCEEESIIRKNMDEFRTQYGDAITPAMHPLIRSTEACYQSTAKAVGLADRYGTQLHVLHLSTARELSLFESKPLGYKKITNEVCVHHLWFDNEDYAQKGNWIKWNPAIKSEHNRRHLREGVRNGKIDVIATDHAPHTIQEKEQPYLFCPSGGPLVQHSLVAMLELSKRGSLTLEELVMKMCHAPAIRFQVRERGFLREGYYADIVIVDPASPWEVNRKNILSKCEWSPFQGTRFSHNVSHTFINGYPVYQDGIMDTSYRGQALVFER